MHSRLEPPALAAIGFAAVLLSVLLTGAVRKIALSQGVLDVPNERSSHDTATPRGGGLSVVITLSAALIAFAWLGAVPVSLAMALLGGGILVASVGIIDDRFTVPAGIRLAVHVAAAAWALLWLGGLPPLRIGAHLVQLGWAGHVLAAVGIVWTLNLFNFMDGIDGIAASEAVFITCGGGLLSLAGGGSTGPGAVGVVFAAACFGFLLWNWPPAKIFMGDVGSGYVGFVIAVLALGAARDDPSAIWAWLILGGAFFVDATVTLVRRSLRGERVHEAHRSHAYQWLVRRWRSHRRVTVVFIAVNVLWLLPCAVLATVFPDESLLILGGALGPLIFLALLAGAGRAETPRA